MCERHGRKDGFFLVGYDPSAGGGPWRLIGGREPAADDEIVVDSTTARQHGIAIGDQARPLHRGAPAGGGAGRPAGGGAALMAWRPQFRVDIEPAAVGVVLAASLLMALLAALIPARAVARLAPAEGFRGGTGRGFWPGAPWPAPGSGCSSRSGASRWPSR